MLATQIRKPHPLSEADLHAAAAATLVGVALFDVDWQDDRDLVLAAALEHLDRARRWIDVAGWPTPAVAA